MADNIVSQNKSAWEHRVYEWRVKHQGTPLVSVNDMANALGIAGRNIKANIKTLKETGAIERIGSIRKGQWIVK